MKAEIEGLPICAISSDIHRAIAGGHVVVEAPPGAGKTTVVPLSLLEAGVGGTSGRGEILVLQPRRLAARMAAARSAALLGERLGERVGYRVRFDTVGGPATRLWFLTEGVLLRRLREDPRLRGVDLVILDEFHERHLDGDIALALLRRLAEQRAAADEPALRLMAMSATLDAEPVARFLAAERLRTEGRSFPVEIEYRPAKSRQDDPPLERKVAAALRELIDRAVIGREAAEPGHVLVFLPGVREIRASAQTCAKLAEAADIEIVTLHGALPRDQQDRAVSSSSRSKLILATNVAETSITIDGVVAVIDSGLARVADSDPASSLPRLSLAPISRASAAQRAGRAGRTRPGLCLRLYGRHDHDTRPEQQQPEIRRLELAGPLLELAAAGIDEPESFPWFEAPKPAAIAVARDLLIALGALDRVGKLTDTGAAMLRFPLHPRLARLILAGIELGVGELAATAAALLAERPLRRSGGPPPRTTDADLLDELELLAGRGDRRSLDPSAQAAVEQAARQLREQARRAATKAKVEPGPKTQAARERAVRQALLAAHPDRVATVRVDEHDRRTLVFAFGGSADLSVDSGVRASPWVVALRSEERREGTHRRAVVRSACAIEPEWLVDLFPEAVTDSEELRFDPGRERVVGESSLRYGKLTIESSAMAKLPEAATAELLLSAARTAGVARFCSAAKANDGAERLAQLRLRAAFIRKHRPEFPELDDALIDAVLAEACVGKCSFAELEQADLLASLAWALGDRAGDHRALDRLAPERVTLAGGRRLSVTYEADRPPWIGSRLQDFIGMRSGPKLIDGQVPLVLHLRAPNRHDVAVTTDLETFWREHYPKLRTRLMRRYPKHAWPEAP